MNLLHVTPYYAPAYAYGGVVRSVEGLTRALARRGHKVTVLTTDALDRESRYAGPADEMMHGVRVLRCHNSLPGLRGALNLSTPHRMRAAALDLMPGMDAVHVHEFRTIENLLVTPVAAAAGVRLVLSPHGTLNRATGRSRIKAAWDRLLSPAVAQRVDVLVGLNASEVADAQALWADFGRRRVPTEFAIVPNGVDPADYADLPDSATFRARWGLGAGPVCLFMGRLHPRKGPHILAEAFRQAAVPGAKLVIAGPDEGLAEPLAALAGQDIILTGFLDGPERLAAFAAADMLALPAVGEGLPMVVLEALAAGLPVIVSPGCYLPEVAAHGAGLEVAAEVAPLTAALRSLLTDAATRAAMGAAARQLVETHFTWDAVALQLERLYR